MLDNRGQDVGACLIDAGDSRDSKRIMEIYDNLPTSVREEIANYPHRVCMYCLVDMCYSNFDSELGYEGDPTEFQWEFTWLTMDEKITQQQTGE